MSTPSFSFPLRLSEKYRPRKVAEFVGLPKGLKLLRAGQVCSESVPVLVSILWPARSRKNFNRASDGRRNGRRVSPPRLTEMQP